MREHVIFAPIQPRGMSRETAAAYCELSVEAFSDWVALGRLPGPFPGTHRWDRKAIDIALDKLSGLETQSTPTSEYEAWRSKRNARRA